MSTLKEGDKAPDFELPTDGGGTVNLSHFHGRKVVLYFYPKDDTPGCTTEAIDFSAALPAFAVAARKRRDRTLHVQCTCQNRRDGRQGPSCRAFAVLFRPMKPAAPLRMRSSCDAMRKSPPRT